MNVRRQAQKRFLITFLVGWAFFLLPVPFRAKWSVPFDIVISTIREQLPEFSSFYTLALVLAGSVLTARALGKKQSGRYHWEQYFRTSLPVAILRFLGAGLALVYFFRLSPDAWNRAGIPGLVWQVLAISVAVIIPVGASVVQLFVDYGGLEFVGTLARPFMRRLFHLPGRAALDALASWVGSYSVGLYITRIVYERGGYSKRDVAVIATCFSTVSMGFVGVVASTLNILHLFPLIVVLYFISIVVLAAILVRIPPIRSYPVVNISGSTLSEGEERGTPGLWQRAWRVAVEKASKSPPIRVAIVRAIVEGLFLAASILGTIVSVGTIALLLAKFTPVFQWLGKPLIPVLHVLGIPQASQVAAAVLIEVTEMYIPALLVVHTSEAARFFVAVLSISQLIFFSSLGPMIMDMFGDIPIRFTDLILLFFLRTLILVPFLAMAVQLLVAAGIVHG